LSHGDLGTISTCPMSIVQYTASRLTVTGDGQEEIDELDDIMFELGLVDVPRTELLDDEAMLDAVVEIPADVDVAEAAADDDEELGAADVLEDEKLDVIW
jgi:hypothetical protein